MIHVKRREHVFERGHRRAFANVIFAKALKRDGAHLHHLSQSIDDVGAVVPKMRDRTRSARRACVLIGEIHESAFECLAQDFVECWAFICARRKVLIAVDNRDLVPLADSFCISVGDVRQTVRTELDQRSGIIHH